jgi:LysM repeat protein
MKTKETGHLRILPMTLASAVMALAGVSCKGTSTTAESGSYDDFYASTGSTGTVGEYDNIYDESGVQKVDDYSGDNSSYEYGSGTDYASNQSGSSGSASTASTSTPPKPKPAPKPVSTPTVAKPKPASSGSVKYHVVQKGETLYRLSRNYGTSVAAIQSANNLNDNLIKIGQKLVIPK